MAMLTVAIPSSLDTAVRDAAKRRRTSLDNLVGVALSEYVKSDRHRIFQVSTSTALVAGVDQGAVSSRTLLEHGDFGLGTFQGKDGEMLVLDGAIYQVHGNGSVERRQDEFRIPFAVVAFFQEEKAIQTGTVPSLKDLESACDPYRESENLFYAMRVEGTFKKVHARALTAAAAGANMLDAAKAQAEFHFTDIEGTMVCFWSPAYSGAFNVPGYHFHFLSKDRTKGGHVLDCSANSLRVGIQMLCEYDVRLPDQGKFLSSDLRKDPTADLAKVE